MSDLVVSIGANIRARREAAGLTQTVLSQAAGTSRAHLSQLETGNAPSSPSLGTLDKLAGVLGCKVADLLYEPVCMTCRDRPPAGFSCNNCGKTTAAEEPS
jgi:transcriptional regulator with XRE-family HTH domain